MKKNDEYPTEKVYVTLPGGEQEEFDTGISLTSPIEGVDTWTQAQSHLTWLRMVALEISLWSRLIDRLER